MEANVEELKEWSNVAKRGLRQAIERLEEREEQISSYMKVLDAVEELLAKINDLKEEVERKQTEIDELEEQLEQKQQEADDLRRQLLEAQNHQLESEKQRLESEKQQLEAEASAKPMEIHNHFGSGCSAQVFNDKVTGKFTKTKKRRWKRIIRKNM
jgi:chromosome segregation ATPase